jgi:uncharacterized protein
VDLDDVLAETARLFLRIVAERFGRQAAFESLSTFHLGESLSLDAEELAVLLEVSHRAEVLAQIAPIPGAAQAPAAWRRRGHEVFIVTGRPTVTRPATLAWLEAQEMAFDELYFLDKYSAVYSHAPTLLEGSLQLGDLPGLELTLAIEDFPLTAEHLAGQLGLPVALFDRPWNRNAPEGARGETGSVVRCRTWQEIGQRFPLA